MKTTTRLALAGVLCLGAAFAAHAKEWTYSNSTITDGQWTLKATLNADETLSITGIGSWSDPGDSSQKGVIDLRAPLSVNNGGTVTAITSVRIGQGGLAYNANVTEIYCDIISSLGTSGFQGNDNMTNIVIGGTAEVLPGLLLNRNKSLKTIKMDFPNLRSAGDSSNPQSILGVNTSPNPIDVSTVASPGITNIYGSAFAHSAWRGDIALTNIMYLGWAAFQGASLTNVSLTGSLKTLPEYVFRGNNSITNVVLDLPNLETINNQAFGYSGNGDTQQKKIRRVELVTALQDMGQVTNIVRYANNSSISDLRIYVSKKQWTPSGLEIYDADTNPTGFFAAKSTLTVEEKAKIDAETLTKVIGVLVKGGTRKGIFVHKTSIHDPLGLFIRFR